MKLDDLQLDGPGISIYNIKYYIYIYGYKYAYISNIRNILSSIDINALIGIKKRKLALQTIFLCFYLERNAREKDI